MNLLFFLLLGCVPRPPDVAVRAPDSRVALGRTLFLRTWVVQDPRAPGGDGLGPVANARSCANCHNQGGPGGGGPEARNVKITTRFLTLTRNPPALFGAGLLDRVGDETIREAAAAIHLTPDISGRVPTDAAGRVGRFGWKGDVARLETFVARACSVELGLEVPGFSQRAALGVPEGPGLDLDQNGLDALTAYVATLPAPAPSDTTPGFGHGRDMFSLAGCDECHFENIGGVRGAYTDLLLHDLGATLADPVASGYYGLPRDVRPVAGVAPPAASEWRTPPLWGLRDSAPYLHDGRAPTVEAAVRAHGGEAEAARARYIALPPEEQEAMLSFLDALAAPS